MIASSDANGILLTDGEDGLRRQLDGAQLYVRAADADKVVARAERRTQAQILIGLARGVGTELYLSPDGTAYADIMVDGHRETWPLASAGFRRWLCRIYYMETAGAPNAEAMTQAIGVLDAIAQFGRPTTTRPVHLRIAEYEDRIYLDMCDPAWRAVEIDKTGWRIVARPRVRFRRRAGMLPLVEPVHGGRLDELRQHLHLTDDSYVLAVSWLLAVLRGRGPYPILALTGEQGTGKSVAADLLRRLIDPHSAPLRSLPRDTRDLYIAALNGHILVFDNLSGIPAEVSDALCRLSTGGGFSTRALYTDDEEVLFDGQRPIALTSIADVATRSDLADRTTIVRLEVIPDAVRRTEEELRVAFEAARPRILGALLDVVAHGLLQLPEVHLKSLPRMADYARWIAACETAIWCAGTHMAAYEVARAEVVETVIESDPVAMAVSHLLEAGSEWSGTATQLLAELTQRVSHHMRRTRHWPRTPRGLAGHLKRLGPALRRAGYTVISARVGHDRNRMLTIRWEDVS